MPSFSFSLSYYMHFMKLVRLINLCLAYNSMKVSDIDVIRVGFQEWVTEYEK